MSANTSERPNDYHDHQLKNKLLMECTTIAIASQQTMLGRIEASIQASSAGVEAFLHQVVESQTYNQQRMIDMMMGLANNISMNNAGVRNEAAAGNSSVNVIPNRQNTSISDEVDEDEIEEVDPEEIRERESALNNQQLVDLLPYLTGYDGYEPLFEAVVYKDWKKVKEYMSVVANQTALKDIFADPTRDSGKQIYSVILGLLNGGQTTLLEEFLEVVPAEALEFRKPGRPGSSVVGRTLLHEAAILGNLRMVETLVKKNRNLTQIRSNVDDPPYVPLIAAAACILDGQEEVVKYLCAVTRDEDPSPFSGKEGPLLMKSLINANMYGVALSVCQRYPESLKQWFAREGPSICPVFRRVVDRPYSFHSGTKLTWWERRIYSVLEEDWESVHDINKQKMESSERTRADEENPPENSTRENTSSTNNKRSIYKRISLYLTRYTRRVPCVNRLYHQKLTHIHAVGLVKCLFAQLVGIAGERNLDMLFLQSGILEIAIKSRTTEFVLECLRLFPFLCADNALLNLVVRERNELIYNFICIQRRKYMKDDWSSSDENWNSILHVCAEVAHDRQLNVVSGAAFQMQREIQWFKGVENTILEKDRFMRNTNGETAQFLFTVKHKDLMEKAEKWMKELSTSCMVVAALIATIAFAAAITVPGGNISDKENRENGLPVFLHEKSFMLFAIADALALFSSVTSVLMFLTVFTSRYSEEDFLKSLPQKIIIGLVTLFISMATMLVSFGAVFTIVVGQRSVWAPITVSLLGFPPVLLFGFMQFPLFFEMLRSTYWPLKLGEEDNPLLVQYLQTEEKNIELGNDNGGKHAWTWITSGITQMVHRSRLVCTWMQMSLGL